MGLFAISYRQQCREVWQTDSTVAKPNGKTTVVSKIQSEKRHRCQFSLFPLWWSKLYQKRRAFWCLPCGALGRCRVYYSSRSGAVSSELMQSITKSRSTLLVVLPLFWQCSLKAWACSLVTLHPKVAICSLLYLSAALFCASVGDIITPPF